MENEFHLQGRVHTKYSSIKQKNGSVMYHFQLLADRNKGFSIDGSSNNLLNCIVPEHIDNNPSKTLAEGNLIRISGNIQSHRVNSNGLKFAQAYLVVTRIHVEDNILLKEPDEKKPEILQTSRKGTYFKGQRYSSEKPYHDNFPKEVDLRGKIKCTCGNIFLDTLDECPACGRSAISILRETKDSTPK